MARPGGPLEPPSGRQEEVALAWRWRRHREGIPSGLFLVVGVLLAKAASHDAVGRADTRVDRWFAAHRTNALNRATHDATKPEATPTMAALTVLTVAGAALAWRWREPMLVAVAVTGEVLTIAAITLLVDRPRPPVMHLDVAPPTSSFPSDHIPIGMLAGALPRTGWLAVTVRGIRLDVRHHELRAETAEKNAGEPARRWPLPRHG
jgi:hypothetical protein